MVNFDIIQVYTEKLTIFNYYEYFGNDENIPLNIGFRGWIEKYGEEKNKIIFKVYYDVESTKFPIVLNWVGVFLLNFDDEPENITEKELFENEDIQQQLNKFIDQFSTNLVGKLPSFTEMMVDNKWT